ncbi:MAG TPA: phosphatase PAP2 family protein [Gemmatimonadaceae bacterium]|jgi:membrane-associated phospholipid phosphatase|nr:phosphatase PAP2 family protein [Gemmatimonadaceae bacterium]
MIQRRFQWAIGLWMFVAGAPASVLAQHLTGHDVAVALGLIAADIALMPVDRSIAQGFQRPGLQSNTGIRRTAQFFSASSDPGAPFITGGLYLAGLVVHDRPVAALGLHATEGVGMAAVMTELLKGMVGRARPRVDITAPHNFGFGRGFGNDNYASFPSGAATAAFAIATVVSRDARHSWPHRARYAVPMAFAAATLVGLSRMYLNEHWASDVVAGAGVGALGGVLVNTFEQDHPDNWVDRRFLPAAR